MDLIIGLIVAVKSLVLMGGYIAPDKNAAHISEMRVVVAHQDIRVSCRIINAFPAELRKLATSGTPILLYVFIEMKQAGNDSVVSSVVTENRLEYDLVTKRFGLMRTAARDTARYTEINEALAASSVFDTMQVLARDRIRPERSYYFIMWAVLGKTRVEALANNTIDLMYFWDYKRPTLRTNPFAGSQLAGGPVMR